MYALVHTPMTNPFSLALRFLSLAMVLPLPPARAQNGAPAPAAKSKPAAPRPPDKYEVMDYGPFVSATIVAPVPGTNITNKGIAIKVGEGAMLFDTDLLRWSAGWTKGFLNLNGVVFDGKHGPNPSVKGEVVFCTAPGPGWTVDARGDLTDPRERPFGPLPATHAKYRGLYLNGDRTIVSYSVAGSAVLEMPGMVTLEGGSTVFTRTVQMEALPDKRGVLIADAAVAITPTTVKNESLAVLDLPAVAESKLIVGLVGAPKEAKLEVQPGGRIVLRLPGSQAATFTVAIWHGPAADQSRFEAWLASAPPPADLKPLLGGGPARWTATVETKGERGADGAPYVLDTITAPDDNPYHSWLRFGGFDFFADGHRAAISTWSGDVWVVSGIDDQLEKLTWKRFATGLFQPLGVRIVKDEVYVLGRDQITRLHDLNGDGEADYYECFNNDVIVSPSFHEFALDLQTDRAGNFYFAKAGAVRPGGRGWQLSTKHTGTVLKVSADGSKLTVFATGVRAPNGLGMGPNDELTLADNEGTWTPACRLNFVKEGDFLGVRDLSQRDPLPDNYGNPILWLPHGEVDNSSGGQAWVTDDRWGPFKGHILHTSYGKCSLFLVMNEKVDGLDQGGVVRFPLKFVTGAMRARFNPVDGQLYVCGLKGWQTDAVRDGAFQRVRYTGRPVEMPTSLRVRPNGIEIGFTAPLDRASATDLQNFALERWNYQWTEAYGSPEFSVANPAEKGHDPVDVRGATLSADGKTLFLEIPDLKPVMQMKIKFVLTSAAGNPLDYEIYHTIAKVPQK
jgi:hypothetical protein